MSEVGAKRVKLDQGLAERDTFEVYNPSHWRTVTAHPGDILQVDGNSAGAGYLVLSKDPLAPTADTIFESVETFKFPVRTAFGLSMSQRIAGQEFSIELVSTDDWPGVTLIPAPTPIALSTVQQATTTLTLVTAAPHGLLPGDRFTVYGCTDSRFNYQMLTVASIPTATSLTATAGPMGTIPSVTAGPLSIGGSIIRDDPLGLARNGVNLLLEGSSATTAGYYARSEASTAMPSGTVLGSHLVSFNSNFTTATQLANVRGSYSFVPAAQFELYGSIDRVVWRTISPDSAAPTVTQFKRTQQVPNPARDYKIRVRASSQRSFSVPATDIVSAVKSGSTTATITTQTAHGLTTGDYITIYGIRDQTNFANLTTATAVASVVNATTFTIAFGASVTATSYGGYVKRINGSYGGGEIAQAVQSVTRTNNQLTVVGNASWSGVAIGEYINLLGVRNSTNGGEVGVDGPYRIVDIATTTMILDPVGNAPTGTDIVLTNAGGGVIKRTDLRLHYARFMEWVQQTVEVMGGVGGGDEETRLVVSGAVTVASGALTASGSAAHDAAISGNPVRIGGRAVSANYTAVATGDVADLITTLVGALVQKPYSIPEGDWTYAGPAAGLTTGSDQAIQAAAGAGLRRYVTNLSIQNNSATATLFELKDGTTVIWRCQCTANMPIIDVQFPTPLRTAANAALNAQAVTAASVVIVNMQGYTAP